MNQARARISPPHEHRRRGLLAASLAVPVSAIVWATLQYASSLSALLVGLLGGATAVCFFRMASDGVVSRKSVPRLVVVATASAALAIAAVFGLQMTAAWTSVTGGSWFAAAGDPAFWSGSVAVVRESSTLLDFTVASIAAAVTCAALIFARPSATDSAQHTLALLARPTV